MIDPELDVDIVNPGECPQCGAESPDSSICPACRRSLYEVPHKMDKFVAKAARNSPETEEPVPAAVWARRELARRELARRKFLPFIQLMEKGYVLGWFVKDLAARLERFVLRVENGESPRMLINVPPRRGKTQQASKLLPAWFLGRNPKRSIIATTHSDDLANDNSRDVLAYVREPLYQSLFPGMRLDKDNQGATGWRTTEGGRYKPAGVGKGISGRGADILLIDDPHRDKDAFSETVRDSIWRWYKATARTRIMPGGGIIVVQTRWVSDDLTGRLIEDEGLIQHGGVWEQVCYPEEATEDEYLRTDGLVVHSPEPDAVLLRRKGECLFPERYPPESNVEHKRDPLTWAALYQQDPTSGEAAIFQKDWFPRVTLADVPERLVYYTAWDTAVSQKDSNAFTAGVVGGVDDDSNLWVVDVIRERWDGFEIIEGILDVFMQYREEATGIERTNHSVATKPFMEKRIDERRLFGANIVDIPHGNKDKVSRARPIQAMCRAGRVFVPADAPWYNVFMKELLEFPGGATKDMVDAFAHLGQMVNDMHEPRKQRQSGGRTVESWARRFTPGRKKTWLTA